MSYLCNRKKAIFVTVVAYAFFFNALNGNFVYAQKTDFDLLFPKCSMQNECLADPYAKYKWKVCASQAAAQIQGCLISIEELKLKTNTCAKASMKITELAAENTRYGPLYTLLVSGVDGNGFDFRYTSICHISKTEELIEFKTVLLH